LQLPGVGVAIGEALTRLNGFPAAWVVQPRPDEPAAGANEQPALAVAQPALQVLQQRRRVVAGQPLRFGHVLLLSNPYPLTPAAISSPGRRAGAGASVAPSGRRSPCS